MDCLFCKIIQEEIPSSKVYEDDKMLVFKDIEPQAPVHLLAIPKTHIPSADALNEENAGVVAHIFAKLPAILKEQGAANGYRIVNNCGKDGMQTVQHLHFHILGGRTLTWPPG